MPRSSSSGGGAMTGAFMGAALALLATPGPSARAAEGNDLRGFRVGMAVAELPPSGYTGFACAERPGVALSGWDEYRRCAPDAATGLRELRFRYDDEASELARSNERYAGTKVAGQPVLLSLLVGGDARVEGLRIRTDPEARLFERRKAFLFGEQIKARYGEEGWACTNAAPGPEEEPVGGVFVREHCEKTTADRRFVLDRWLFRRPGEELRRFVGGTALTILRRAGQEDPPPR